MAAKAQESDESSSISVKQSYLAANSSSSSSISKIVVQYLKYHFSE